MVPAPEKNSLILSGVEWKLTFPTKIVVEAPPSPLGAPPSLPVGLSLERLTLRFLPSKLTPCSLSMAFLASEALEYSTKAIPLGYP